MMSRLEVFVLRVEIQVESAMIRRVVVPYHYSLRRKKPFVNTSDGSYEPSKYNRLDRDEVSYGS